MTAPAAPVYSYFVRWSGLRAGSGIDRGSALPESGWSEFRRTAPIRSGEDIKDIEAALKSDNGLIRAEVLSFQRFDTEAGAA